MRPVVLCFLQLVVVQCLEQPLTIAKLVTESQLQVQLTVGSQLGQQLIVGSQLGLQLIVGSLLVELMQSTTIDLQLTVKLWMQLVWKILELAVMRLLIAQCLLVMLVRLSVLAIELIRS